MLNRKVYTPSGVQDILFEECAIKREMEQNIRTHLKENGYREIETPTIEYYDTFSSGAGKIDQEKMFKFSAADGRMLVLRPDLTIPAVRTYATKLRKNDDVVKLFYIGNAFNPMASGGGKLKEFTQAGAEIIGVSGEAVDAEIISRAIMLAKSIGMEAFLIDICQVEFFKGIIEEAGFSEAEGEEIRRMVDGKQISNLEILLRNKQISDTLRELIIRLPNLFGGVEVLDAAEKYTIYQRNRFSLYQRGPLRYVN